MKLQVIVSGDGWVLDKHGEMLAGAFGGDLRKHPKEMPNDGITYLMNYAQGRKLELFDCYGKVVSMLTHHEPRMNDTWHNACKLSDALVPMSDTTRASITEVKSGAIVQTIPLPVPDYITKRKPRIGIAGIRNPANEHRKGWDLVDRLRADHPEYDITVTGGNLSESDMLAWYRSLDLYLCPSRYEGGPMGVIEAVAMGIDIVAPRGVGWCDDIKAYFEPHYSAFTPGDYDSMETAVMMEAADGYEHDLTTTSDYIESHRRLFDSLI